MTKDHQMAMMYGAQEAVIVALRGIEKPDLADRLDRCMQARRERTATIVGRSPVDLLDLSGAADR
jgi:hypothetical protein